MSARKKLNSAYFGGSLLVAGLVGWLLQSWLASILVLAGLVALNLNNGDIRLGRRGDR